MDWGTPRFLPVRVTVSSWDRVRVRRGRAGRRRARIEIRGRWEGGSGVVTGAGVRATVVVGGYLYALLV